MRIFYEGWCILERPNSAVTTAKFTEINTSPSVATDEMEQAIVNEGVPILTHPLCEKKRGCAYFDTPPQDAYCHSSSGSSSQSK